MNSIVILVTLFLFLLGVAVAAAYLYREKLKISQVKDDDFWTQIEDIDDKYDLILKRFENHDDIDSKLFRASYKSMNNIQGVKHVDYIILYAPIFSEQ